MSTDQYNDLSLFPADPNYGDVDALGNPVLSPEQVARKRAAIWTRPTEHDACGVAANIHPRRGESRETTQETVNMLALMQERTGVNSDGKTGDGSGIEAGMPTQFFKRVFKEITSVDLGDRKLGVGSFFLQREDKERAEVVKIVNSVLERLEGVNAVEIAWRDVPTSDDVLGPIGKAVEPHNSQVLIPVPEGVADKAFNFALYLARRKIEKEIREQNASSEEQELHFYASSMSCTSVIYKGMTLATDVMGYYQDLQQDDFAISWGKVHGRFSTNTSPTPERAHPFRALAHNGEITTLNSNKANMSALNSLLSRAFGEEDAGYIFPIIQEFGSDSSDMDNVYEALMFAGYDLEVLKSLLMPEAYENDPTIPEEHKNVYRAMSTYSAPWDGPATVALSDGEWVLFGGDRSGFRPVRYIITTDGQVIMGSKDGIVPIDESKIQERGNLAPGEMLAVNVLTGEIRRDKDLKVNVREKFQHLADKIKAGAVIWHTPDNTAQAVYDSESDFEALRQRQRFAGFTEEIVETLVSMSQEGKETNESMGHDAQENYLAGENAHLPFSHYFKQDFAQVTKPPLDSQREIKTSLEVMCGSFEDENGQDFDRPLIHLKSPIISCKSFQKLKADNCEVIQTTFSLNSEDGEIERILDEDILPRALRAAREGRHIVLSDKSFDECNAIIPVQLVISAINAHLNDHDVRHQTAIHVETAEVREPHDVATVVGMGANSVNPYLGEETVVFETPDDEGQDAAVEKYYKANDKALLKIMSKVGAATVASYIGSMLFGAYGLSKEFTDKYFPGVAPSAIGGNSLNLVERRIRKHHKKHAEAQLKDPLAIGSLKRKREGGLQPHASDSWGNRLLRDAASIDDPDKSWGAYQLYMRYKQRLRSSESPARTRYHLDFVDGRESVPVEEVESEEQIMQRFATGAISFGSISKEAHEAMAIAMNTIAAMAEPNSRFKASSNTGEGGEDSTRYRRGNPKRSRIKQIASGNFGVTPPYMDDADELQLKIIQGAKPGLGGELAGEKNTGDVPGLRGSKPLQSLVSPPPHHDIYSIEDLGAKITSLKSVNPRATVSVKLGQNPGVDIVASGVVKAGADAITISGGEGGTGNSPASAINHSGFDFDWFTAQAHYQLIQDGGDARTGTALEVDGGIKTGWEVALAFVLGADKVGIGTASLEAMGCQEARVCHKGTCPVGVATQSDALRANFMKQRVEEFAANWEDHSEVLEDVRKSLGFRTRDELITAARDPAQQQSLKSEIATHLAAKNLINFLRNVAKETRHIMAGLGVTSVDEMIGNTDLVEQVSGKEVGVDFDGVLLRDIPAESKKVHYNPKAHRREYTNPVDPNWSVLDARLWNENSNDILAGGATLESQVTCEDHDIGAGIAHNIRDYFNNTSTEGISDDFLFNCELKGVAGQALGNAISKGVHLTLVGSSNDFVGKHMGEGASITVKPYDNTTIALNPEANTIVGNSCLYGATGGDFCFDGKGGSRFAVRNTGAKGTVLGAQDDACAFMCAGEVTVLGEVGRNFGAGMTGGTAFLFDGDNTLVGRSSSDVQSHMKRVSEVDGAADRLRVHIQSHIEKTGSRYARKLLDDWNNTVKSFVIVDFDADEYSQSVDAYQGSAQFPHPVAV